VTGTAVSNSSLGCQYLVLYLFGRMEGYPVYQLGQQFPPGGIFIIPVGNHPQPGAPQAFILSPSSGEYPSHLPVSIMPSYLPAVSECRLDQTQPPADTVNPMQFAVQGSEGWLPFQSDSGYPGTNDVSFQHMLSHDPISRDHKG